MLEAGKRKGSTSMEGQRSTVLRPRCLGTRLDHVKRGSTAWAIELVGSVVLFMNPAPLAEQLQYLLVGRSFNPIFG